MLTKKSMNINGEYIEDLIDGYTTTDVTGRGMLSVDTSTIDIGFSDGSVYKNKRYPSRTLTVSFVIEGGESSILLKKLEKLSEILDAENAKLIFRDEADRYYIGTRTGNPSIEEFLGVIKGSFDLLCVDPFKYSVTEYEVEPVATSIVDEDGNTVVGKAFNVNYNGTYKSFPVFETQFYSENEVSEDGTSLNPLTGNGDCGFVAFLNENGKNIQLGNPDETQGEDFEPSQTLTNQIFNAKTSWDAAAQSLWIQNDSIIPPSDIIPEADMIQAGTLNMKEITTKPSEWYLVTKNYNSGKKWHGPSITRTLPEDATGIVGATNFTFSYSQQFCVSETSQRGSFHALAVGYNGDERFVVAGVNIIKSSKGKNASVEFIVNNKVISSETMDIDVTKNNPYFGIAKAETKKTAAIIPVRTSVITKSGDTVIFNIGGHEKSFTDPAIVDLVVTEYSFIFTKYGTVGAFSRNGLFDAKFRKDNCIVWRNIPNKFTVNDNLIAKCRTGEVLLNNTSAPEYGAIGNDWEEFYLEPGNNLIGITYSDFVEEAYAPTFKMRYREVFL